MVTFSSFFRTRLFLNSLSANNNCVTGVQPSATPENTYESYQLNLLVYKVL